MVKVVKVAIKRALNRVFSDYFSQMLVVEGTWYPEGEFKADGHVYAWYKDPQRAMAIFLVYRGKEE